jgi:aminopeptidase N
LRTGETPEPDRDFIAALRRVLESSDADPALVAQIITFPGEADIAREIGENVDPDAIFAARKLLRESVGEGLAASLLDTYRKLTDFAPYSPDAASAGRRALRNAALDLYIAGQKDRVPELALQQFSEAQCMTDKIAALGVLAMKAGPERETALAAFYDEYADEPLVIDKWFALQATIPEPETLARVRSLMQHPAFSLGNPNRVRALIGAFATGNLTRFNAKDGSGYDLLVEVVLALNSKNPQVAARMLATFKSWRIFEAERREHAERALRRVAGTPHLSPDVQDIAERSLA